MSIEVWAASSVCGSAPLPRRSTTSARAGTALTATVGAMIAAAKPARTKEAGFMESLRVSCAAALWHRHLPGGYCRLTYQANSIDAFARVMVHGAAEKR